jgi:V-type H+-transporting ATPase subunit a
MNPSIFTTVTFPFFFGVMFGDIGHGAVLFALGLYLIFNDDWIRKGGGFLKTLSKLRYMITLMGFFAFYCGWIYNDIIGFSYNIFGSCYDPTAIDPE